MTSPAIFSPAVWKRTLVAPSKSTVKRISETRLRKNRCVPEAFATRKAASAPDWLTGISNEKPLPLKEIPSAAGETATKEVFPSVTLPGNSATCPSEARFVRVWTDAPSDRRMASPFAHCGWEPSARSASVAVNTTSPASGTSGFTSPGVFPEPLTSGISMASPQDASSARAGTKRINAFFISVNF